MIGGPPISLASNWRLDMATFSGKTMRWVCGVLFAWMISSSASAQSTANNWYRLNYVVGTTVHDALLTLSGDQGWMYVRYFDPRIAGTRIVRMRMQSQNTTLGLALKASNVIDTSTGLPFAAYAPDNLVTRMAPDGSVTTYVFDARNNLALASVRVLTRSADQKQAIREFNLK